MNYFITILLFLNFSFAFAHGEDKLGPHNGFIRMPAAFHTELVPMKDGTFIVYLMDVGNQNPTIKDSSVKLSYMNKSTKIKFSCVPNIDHFLCKSKEVIKDQVGAMVINAIRLGNKSKDATYELPLSLVGAVKPHDMSNMK